MKKISCIIFIASILSSCSPKLKVYRIHVPRYGKKKLTKNFYMKDHGRSFENLKGTWMWSNSTDTLTLKIKPYYKKPYESKIFDYENAFYDSSSIKMKYVKNGKIVFDNLDEDILDSCLYARTFEIHTDMFYLNNRCNSKFTGAYLIFMNDFNGLSLLGRATDRTVLLKKENEYEVVIPNSIILDRIIE